MRIFFFVDKNMKIIRRLWYLVREGKFPTFEFYAINMFDKRGIFKYGIVIFFNLFGDKFWRYVKIVDYKNTLESITI